MIKAINNKGIFFCGTKKEFLEFLRNNMWSHITLKELLKIRMRKPVV